MTVTYLTFQRNNQQHKLNSVAVITQHLGLCLVEKPQPLFSKHGLSTFQPHTPPPSSKNTISKSPLQTPKPAIPISSWESQSRALPAPPVSSHHPQSSKFRTGPASSPLTIEPGPTPQPSRMQWTGYNSTPHRPKQKHRSNN